MEFTGECYECGHMWFTDDHDEPCPVCGEEDNIGMDNKEELV